MFKESTCTSSQKRKHTLYVLQFLYSNKRAACKWFQEITKQPVMILSTLKHRMRGNNKKILIKPSQWILRNVKMETSSMREWNSKWSMTEENPEMESLLKPVGLYTESKRWKSEGSKSSNSEIETEKRQPRGNTHSNPDDQSKRTEPEDKKKILTLSVNLKGESFRAGIAQVLTISRDGRIFRTAPTQNLDLEM